MKKRSSKIKPQTWTAASEAPPGAERPLRVNPCLSIPFHPQISPNFGPQFLRRNRIGILPGDRNSTTNRKDRSFDTAVNSHCTQNRGYTDTSLTIVLVLFNMHGQTGRWETSLGQRNTGTKREQCRKPGWKRSHLEQLVKHGQNMLFGKEWKKGQKDAFFKGIKKRWGIN